MDHFPRDTRSPTLRLLAESSAVLEIASFLALKRPLGRILPRGDGHPVLLIPGFMVSDSSMRLLRRALLDLGYQASGWGLGRNLGIDRKTLQTLQEKVAGLADTTGRRVSLIGWSGGGLYARAAASLQPESVRQVITLGSPFRLTEESLHHLPGGIHKLHERLARNRPVDNPPLEPRWWNDSIPVPSTSLFSQRDALAPWPFCVDPADEQSESIQLRGSHSGLPFNPLTHWIIADRLAQPEQQWQPYPIKPAHRSLFRHHCASQFAP